MSVTTQANTTGAIEPTPRRREGWQNFWLAPVSAHSLALFRIGFGAILLVEIFRYFNNNWIYTFYIEPAFFFSYLPFIQPWGGAGMYWHFGLVGFTALLIMLGFFYRLAAWLFFFGFSYIFLLDKTQYLNHFYLVCLLGFILALIPAHRVWSLDRRRSFPPPPATIPRWCLWLLRFQICIVYLYGGIAKLNEDWLRGEPLGSWFTARSDMPLVGSFLAMPPAGLVFAWAGLALDLSVSFLLLWKRTFWLGAGLALVFNLINSQIFQIGIFPFVMITALVLFPRPDWPLLVGNRLMRLVTRGRVLRLPPAPPQLRPLAETSPTLNDTTGPTPKLGGGAVSRPGLATRVLLFMLPVYLLAQLLIPLRHWLYPGEVNWTEEGHRFSWQMKLRDKEASIMMYSRAPQGVVGYELDLSQYLNARQISKMSTRPDMIIQFAHYYADRQAKTYGVRPVVTATVVASLNKRPYQNLIDPEVDLAAQPINLWPSNWIVPLQPANPSEVR